jgi:hypothetical protein
VIVTLDSQLPWSCLFGGGGAFAVPRVLGGRPAIAAPPLEAVERVAEPVEARAAVSPAAAAAKAISAVAADLLASRATRTIEPSSPAPPTNLRVRAWLRRGSRALQGICYVPAQFNAA